MIVARPGISSAENELCSFAQPMNNATNATKIDFSVFINVKIWFNQVIFELFIKSSATKVIKFIKKSHTHPFPLLPKKVEDYLKSSTIIIPEYSPVILLKASSSSENVAVCVPSSLAATITEPLAMGALAKICPFEFVSVYHE